jgi:hypothetical protein
LGLAREAVRVTRPGGHVALNFRTWSSSDFVLWPTGKIVRAMFRLPGIGPAMARQRVTARFGWQANRLAPEQVLAAVSPGLCGIRIVRAPNRPAFRLGDVTQSTFEGVNHSHWWLIAQVA